MGEGRQLNVKPDHLARDFNDLHGSHNIHQYVPSAEHSDSPAEQAIAGRRRLASVTPQDIGDIVYFNTKTERWNNLTPYTIDKGTKAKVVQFDKKKQEAVNQKERYAFKFWRPAAKHAADLGRFIPNSTVLVTADTVRRLVRCLSRRAAN